MNQVWEIFFWISGAIIVYAFGGYGIVLSILLAIRRILGMKAKKPVLPPEEQWPEVSLIIAAYNEKDYVDFKIHNSMELDYPKDKLKIIWVNDGSDDGSAEMVAQYQDVQLLHNPQRSGKIEAMNRGVEYARSPIILFSDANTMLSSNSVREVVKHFTNPEVGCVAGEKRFYKDPDEPVAAVGEGIYWKIESWLKRLDYQFYSAIGATGELFALRRELYKRVENDTLLDDFIISMRVAQQGYRVAYEPEAYASEHGSSDVKEELKRKIRIAAGCYQSLFRLKKLLNPFRNFKLFFQYVSHKVIRWTLAPLSLISLALATIMILTKSNGWDSFSFYSVAFILQLSIYGLACLGSLSQNRPFMPKWLYAPFYFVVMNYASFLGFIRFLKGKQSVLWEKANRAGGKHK